MTDIVRQNSTSFEDIFNDLLNYSLSRNDITFQNMALSDPGVIILDWISGLGAFLNYDILSARIETDKNLARLDSTIISMAHLLGYPVRRRTSPKLKLGVVNNTGSEVNLLRSTPVGKFKTLNISILEDTILPIGLSYIYCVIGNWKVHTFRPRSVGSFARYLLQIDSVENDITFTSPDGEQTFDMLRLYVATSGAEDEKTSVSLVEFANEMDSQAVNILTHHNGIIFVFGDDIYGRQVEKEDIYTFEYISTDGIISYTNLSESLDSITLSNSELNLYSSSLLSPGSAGDSMEKIRSLMSGYNYAKRKMVTIEDHKSILLSYPGIVGANAVQIDEDSGCCSVKLTCLFEQGKILDQDTTLAIDDFEYDISPSKVIFQEFALDANSFMLPNSDFTDALGTGSRVWIEMYPHENCFIPIGLQSGRFYYIVEGQEHEDTDRFYMFASSQAGVLTNSIILLSPPLGDSTVEFDLYMRNFSDTVVTNRNLDVFSYFMPDMGSKDASSFIISNEYEGVVFGTSSPVLVEYLNTSRILTPLLHNTVYYAIASEDSSPKRIQFALTEELAIERDRMKIAALTTGYSNILTITTFFDSHFFENTELESGDDLEVVTQDGDLCFKISGYTSFLLPIHENFITDDPDKSRFKVRFLKEAVVFINNIVHNRDYYIEMEKTASYYVMRVYEDENYANRVTVNGIVGDFRLLIYHETEEGNVILINISDSTYTSELKYTLSNSINLSNTGTYNSETTRGLPHIVTGMMCRINTDSDDSVLPANIDDGGFYYIISLGNGYFRLASTPVTEDLNIDDGYVQFSEEDLSDIAGKISIDFFVDSIRYEGETAIDKDRVFYRQESLQTNYINVNGTPLVGNGNVAGGYPTGTKISFNYNNSTIDTVNFLRDSSTFYYIIRVDGFPYIKLATSKSNALIGQYIELYGDVPTDTIDIFIYDTPQENELRLYLEQYRIAGQRILFEDPIGRSLAPVLTVVMEPSYSVKTVKEQIRDIFLYYQYKMGITLYIGDISKQISNLDGVLRVYIEEPSEDIELGVNEYFKINVEVDLIPNITVLSGKDAVYESGD